MELTPKQEAFLKEAPNGFIASLSQQWTRFHKLSDKQLEALNKAMEREANPPPKLEPGVYEYEGQIYIIKPNLQKTKMYAKKLVEISGKRLTEADTIVHIEFEFAPGIIYKLTPEMKMPFEKAKELAIRYGKCFVCNRWLKDATSVERGIGPICMKYFA